jgi:hypothetical protein
MSIDNTGQQSDLADLSCDRRVNAMPIGAAADGYVVAIGGHLRDMTAPRGSVGDKRRNSHAGRRRYRAGYETPDRGFPCPA